MEKLKFWLCKTIKSESENQKSKLAQIFRNTFEIHYKQLLKISRSYRTPKNNYGQKNRPRYFPFREKKSYSKISTSLSRRKFWLLIQFLWPYKVKVLVPQKVFSHFQQFSKEWWRQQFKKNFFIIFMIYKIL